MMRLFYVENTLLELLVRIDKSADYLSDFTCVWIKSTVVKQNGTVESTT